VREMHIISSLPLIDELKRAVLGENLLRLLGRI